MDNPELATPSQMTNPQQPAPKKGRGKGCFIAIGIFVFLLVLGAILSDGDKKESIETTAIDTTAIDTMAIIGDEFVIENGPVIENTASLVDSVRIKALSPLFKRDIR